MIANELRIGNVVGMHGERLPTLKITREILSNILNYDWYMETLYPIEITEDILKQLGFEKYHDEENETNIWSLGTFDLYQEAWSEEHITNDFSYATRLRGNRFKSGITIKYLHKLQNLFFETQLKELDLVKPLTFG